MTASEIELRRQVGQLQRQVARLEREADCHRSSLAGGIVKVMAMLRRVDAAQQAVIEALRDQLTDPAVRVAGSAAAQARGRAPRWMRPRAISAP